MYRADQSISLATVIRIDEEVPISSRRMQKSNPLTIVASRRHGGEALEACVAVLNKHFTAIEKTNMGSSLKLCLIAEGKADLYPRLAPTSEWDTAAGVCILEGAGGKVIDLQGQFLKYNTKEDIKSPPFFASA